MLRKMYKIHGIDTVNGLVSSANTRKFYDSHDEAVEAATKCCTNKTNPPAGIVIFKAVTLVRPKAAPVEVIDVETGEEI